MPGPVACLVGFALWTLSLLTAIGLARSSQVLMGKKRANEFPSGTQHGGERYWRLNRAHVNCCENLPVWGAIILGGTWLHVSSWAFFHLPPILLGARILQSLVHISSGRSRAVTVRFYLFVTQLVCLFWLGIQVLRAAL
jgi:hypothetical protein